MRAKTICNIADKYYRKGKSVLIELTKRLRPYNKPYREKCHRNKRHTTKPKGNNQEKELNVIRNGRVAKDKSKMRDNEAGTDLVRRNGDTDERRKKRVDIVRTT